MNKSKVYFTKEITSESLVKIYEALGIELKGNVGVKLHTGEKGNQNYLRPEFMKELIDKVIELKIVSEHMWYLKGEI